MSLTADYQRQRPWRPWREIFSALPPLAGETVLDLGCGVGDQAAELVARGARVVGVDLNEELLAAARARGLANAEFHLGDLRDLSKLGLDLCAGGLWSSFTAAYFPDLAATLRAWSRHLAPGAWVALTEVDDLFGHEPVPARTRELLRAYAEESLAAGRYDFFSGHKLRAQLEAAGFRVERELVCEDQELAFHGPAQPEVLAAWAARFDRMKLLQAFCGEDFDAIRTSFLAALASSEHESRATVRFCLART